MFTNSPNFNFRYSKLFARTAWILVLIAVGKDLTTNQVAYAQDNNNYTGRALFVSSQEATLSGEILAKIDAIKVREGDRVKVGQVLVVFNCEAARAEHDKAKANVMAARATTRSRRRLHEMKSESKLNLTMAEAELLRSSAELAQTQAYLKRCVVKAPFSGAIVEIKVNAHESIRPGQPLMHIVAAARLRVEAFVPSKWISWLKNGASFKVIVDEPNNTYAATVEYIIPRIDPASQTVKIIGRLRGAKPSLVPGMGGTAYFVPPAPNP